MYQLIRRQSLKGITFETLPPLIASLLVAEFFYKWHSFTLECAGFLATWFVMDWLWWTVRRKLLNQAQQAE
jgi:hypothetical protein